MKKIKRLGALCLMLLMLTGTLFVTAASAEEPPEIRMERVMPEKLKGGKEAEITLRIDAEGDFFLGIAETLPEGWTFPENDAEVTDCPAFEIDREQGRIAFAADSLSEIHYTVIPAKDAPGEIKGEYVDLIYRTQESEQGRNMWRTVGGGAEAAGEMTSAAESNSDRSNTTVWVIVLVLAVVLVLLLGKIFIGKGPKNEK